MITETMFFLRLFIFATLVSFQIVTADVHKNLYCVSVKLSSNTTSEVQSPNNTWIPLDSATEQACLSYKRRNKGKNHWDICPDCEIITLNEVIQCKSATGRLNDNLFQDFCRLFGATYSEPRATGKKSWWSTLRQRIKLWFGW
ncbi:hypothetical protein HI914_03035 [Erysiphe necator]|nr:hypothetical protein HI914_03035 [Erysiphe necator]